MPNPTTNNAIFNPKILDASIRDVSSCLSDNQKADLLLYAMNSLSYEGPSRTILSNAIQSLLALPTLSPENVARTRIMRARARLREGTGAVGGGVGGLLWDVQGGVREDLHAALEAEPDNPEAKALLHQRSVNVEKLLAPAPPPLPSLTRFSTEIWSSIAGFLPRRELVGLISWGNEDALGLGREGKIKYIPKELAKVVRQRLWRKIDLDFGGILGLSPSDQVTSTGVYDEEDEAREYKGSPLKDRHRGSDYQRRSPLPYPNQNSDQTHRTADILTRIITDQAFALGVRTLRAWFTPSLSRVGFQIGMLSNALPKMTNLQHVHITSPADGLLPLLHILQTSHPRLRGLSLRVIDGSIDFSSLTFKYLAHFSYETNTSFNNTSPSPMSTSIPNFATFSSSLPSFLIQNRSHLQTLSIKDSHNIFPSTTSIAIRNFTHLTILGQLPLSSIQLIPDILQHGRQLEFLNLTFTGLPDCPLSPYFRSMANSLPFLRHFTFEIPTDATGSFRRFGDRDLFPSIADFLRDRKELKTLGLLVRSLSGAGGEAESVLRATGFDASLWGVLPSLVGLKGLRITYPRDLAPALGMWLIPRTVVTLMIDGLGIQGARDPVGLLNQLRPGVPPSLLFISLSDFPLRSVTQIVEQGFPMVRLICVGTTYWTILNNLEGYVPGSRFGISGRPSPRLHSSGSASSSHKSASPSFSPFVPYVTGPGVPPIPIAPAGPINGIPSTMNMSMLGGDSPEIGMGRKLSVGPGSAASSVAGSSSDRSSASVLELEQWPKRRAALHLREWLEWFGCKDGEVPEHQQFIFR